MSLNDWDWSSAAAEDLLTFNERSLLLEVDLLNSDGDLLKNISDAAPKFESSYPGDDVTTLYPPSPVENKPSRAELANDLLQQLESQCKQENLFPNWLEEKVDQPIFENFTQLAERIELPQTTLPAVSVPYPTQTLPQPTEELLREFETVYGVVKLTHLTPPQSPPGPATQLLLNYAQQAQCAVLPSIPQPTTPETWSDVAVPTILSDYDCDSQVLEDLVRHRAAQLASPEHSGDSVSASPHSSPPSSPRSSSTDEEWSTPSRPKPYSRNVDDRRSRKKEQNKNAATRYRQKKKAEVEVLLSEENSLRKHHVELGDKCADLQREIRYLKGLMRDLFKAKGLIK